MRSRSWKMIYTFKLNEDAEDEMWAQGYTFSCLLKAKRRVKLFNQTYSNLFAKLIEVQS